MGVEVKHNVSGVVVTGNKRGSKLGFPTANIDLKRGYILDPGIYAGWIQICDDSNRPLSIRRKSRFISAVYVHPHKPLLEAHILDFEGDLYGEHLKIELLAKIRSSRKFETEEALKKAIDADIKEVRCYFRWVVVDGKQKF